MKPSQKCHIQTHNVDHVENQCKKIQQGDLTGAFSNWFRKDIAEMSGLNSTTIRTLIDGKKPTHAQKSALCWAIAVKEFNLKVHA